MSTRFKKIFLSLSIALPFLAYCVYYYGQMIRNAPYKYSELVSIQFAAGQGKKVLADYNSEKAMYNYRTGRNDSLVHVKVKLFDRDRFYLHKQAADIGLWNMPDSMAGSGNAPYYEVVFNYKRKSKRIYIAMDYRGKMKLKDAAIQISRTVEKTINDAEDQQSAKGE
ncbi:MAG: hypothetical protein INR69_01285 [Mucilaginibacter polytrichastri]|nr:hypothetical protein [Mucilaginibacter polytrichastri]